MDNFSFAKCRFKNEKLKLVNIQILSFIILTNVVNLILAHHKFSLNAIFRQFFYSIFFFAHCRPEQHEIFCSEITVQYQNLDFFTFTQMKENNMHSYNNSSITEL
jgi:hypothetical protein